MQKTLLFSFVLIAMTACGGSSSGGGGNGTQIKQFSSAYDPCSEGNACTNIKNLSIEQAMNLFENSSSYSKAKIGTEVTAQVEKTDFTYVYDADLQDFKEVKCDVSYSLKRLLVDMDDKYIYVEEKKSNLQTKPESKDCLDLINDPSGEYQRTIIAKEDRAELIGAQMDEEAREMIENFSIQSLNYKGKPAIRISGVAEMEIPVKDDQNSDLSIKGTVGMLSMSDLSVNYFQSQIVQHTRSNFEHFKSEEVSIKKGVRTGVRVDHVDITTMSDGEMEDRTEEGE